MFFAASVLLSHLISHVRVFLYRVCSGNFRALDVSTIFTTKCGAFHFSQEIFVHVAYVPWPPDNTGARSGLPQQQMAFPLGLKEFEENPISSS